MTTEITSGSNGSASLPRSSGETHPGTPFSKYRRDELPEELGDHDVHHQLPEELRRDAPRNALQQAQENGVHEELGDHNVHRLPGREAELSVH
jgi:hypothetical protein